MSGAAEAPRPWSVAVAVALAAAAFASAIPGGFVSDDDVQIARNDWLADPALLWSALSSDVWGFAGTAEGPTSHYWRPMFVLWLAAQRALFGLAPAGWHVSSLLLHCAVLLAAAAVLRRLDLQPAAATAVLWVFATHPVHVEAVAWSSGAPDPLAAFFLLATHALHLAGRRLPACALFAAAALSKETALAYPLFVGACVRPFRVATAARAAAPYAAIAALVLAARIALLGSAFGDPARTSAGASMGRLADVLVFYLRQAFWPGELSPVYALPDGGILSVVIVAAVGLAAAWAWRRDAASQVGVALFAAFLVPPVASLGQLEPDRLVQDRYLYLPLLGLSIVVFQALAYRIGHRTLLAGAFAVALGLAALTARYNLAWRDDIALWERAVEVHPGSAYALGTLGYHYRVAGRAAEARAMLVRAESLDADNPQVLLDLAILAADERRPRQAERLLRRVLEVDPTNETAPDHLGRLLLGLGAPGAAIDVFEAARRSRPDLALKHTLNLAIACRAAGLDERAIAELEPVRQTLARQRDPSLLLGLWQLAEAEQGLGRREAARADYALFLESSTGLDGPLLEQHRTLARERIAGSF